MNVGFYHYLKVSSVTDAINEAKYFEQSVVSLGFTKDTPLCVDIEDPSLDTNNVASYIGHLSTICQYEVIQTLFNIH